MKNTNSNSKKHLLSSIAAVAAMICDHIAWTFVDEFSVLGQIMHTVGRITIPTMCFL